VKSLSTSIKKIYGSPGTGKTTRILKEITQSGIPLDRVAFVSFTRKAVREARERLAGDADLSHWRTLHSLCYHLLGMKQKDLAESHLHLFKAKLSKRLLMHVKTENNLVPVLKSDTIDDMFYEEMQKERVALLPITHVPQKFIRHADLYIDFKMRYRDWKEENGYTDFVGMIEKCIDKGLVPPVDLLAVDEWQDLSPLQVRLVNFWTQNIPYSIHAGDDDQTIHEWAGARHEDFLAFPTFSVNERSDVILDKTYRLPKNILDMTTTYIRRNKNRVEKNFASENDTAGVIRTATIQEVADILKREVQNGTCMVLVRNNCLKNHIYADLYRAGVPMVGANSKLLRVIAFMLETEDTLTINDVFLLGDKSISHFKQGTLLERGAKKKLCGLAEAMSIAGEETIPIETVLEYGVKSELLRAVRERDVTVLYDKTGKDLRTALDIYRQFGKEYNPVEIHTIHSQKGAEADTVVVALDVTKGTLNAYRDPRQTEAERRVWYVAMTRTKRNLIFLEHTYNGFYPSPLSTFIKVYGKQCNEARTDSTRKA